MQKHKITNVTSPLIVQHKVRGSVTAHLRAAPPFSCISLDGNIFSSFFGQREID